MLPISSTLSANTSLTAPRRVLRVQHVVEAQEPLSGEWQGARKKSKAKQRTILEGELLVDREAVSRYLAAAGELPEVTAGELISVYA